MKKLHFNSTLNHKASDYKPCEICVERVVTLYGRSFEELKNHLMHDDPYIVAYRDLMYTEGDTAHCLLFVDYDSGMEYWWSPKAAITPENHSLSPTQEHCWRAMK